MLNSGSSIDEIYSLAESSGNTLQKSAAILGSSHITKPNLWLHPIDNDAIYADSNINLACSTRGDIITSMANMLSEYMQFPPSTIFLHCLGCVSAAMTRSFKVDYGGKAGMYANLYIVTAQPPSTGKSAINDFCFSAVHEAYNEHNQKNAKERHMLEVEIDKIMKDLDKSDINEHDVDELFDRLEKKKRRLRNVAFIKPTITNATIEAMERDTGKQGGMFNIVSDEADSINVVFGAVYSDDKSSSKSNSELLLKGWDNGFVSSTRIGRDGLDSRVRGTISVLAQSDSVDTILAAGASGRGLAERFFLLNESSWLGNRDRSKRGRFDKNIHSIYESMITNIVNQDELTLNFTQSADDVFTFYEMSIEKKMAEDGEYSHNLLTGFIGKAAKQCRKIAAVLHVAEHWQDSGQRSLSITDDYASWAISIFEELSKTFKNASDSLGHVGDNSEIEKLINVITRSAEKGRLKMTISSLRDAVKNVKPFKGSRNLTKRLKDKSIPKLESLNYCVLEGQTIYINPRLK